MTPRTVQKIAVALLAFLGLGSAAMTIAHAVTTTSGTSVVVTPDGTNYGRHYNVTVDGPVSLVIVPAATISGAQGCTAVYGSAGPHQSGYAIGANCEGPGTVVFDTITYPACDAHLVVFADSTDVVFDQLIGSGNCGPAPTTTTTTPPPTTTSTTIAGRHCLTYRYGKGGSKTCIRWSS